MTTNLTPVELEDQVRVLSERLRKYVDIVEEHEERINTLEDQLAGRNESRLVDDLNSSPQTIKRDSEYDRMDALDSALDSEIRRDEV